jgi:glyceraldehyde 3-phosphate dehydrogenase
MVPTTTGAAKAVALVIPELKGKFQGYAIRVPTPTVSVVDFTVLLNKATTVEDVNKALIEASQTEKMEGILGISEDPLVSSDFAGNPHSSIVDIALTTASSDRLFKVVSWYDNEWGYSMRVADITSYIADSL